MTWKPAATYIPALNNWITIKYRGNIVRHFIRILVYVKFLYAEDALAVNILCKVIEKMFLKY